MIGGIVKVDILRNIHNAEGLFYMCKDMVADIKFGENSSNKVVLNLDNEGEQGLCVCNTIEVKSTNINVFIETYKLGRPVVIKGNKVYCNLNPNDSEFSLLRLIKVANSDIEDTDVFVGIKIK